MTPPFSPFPFAGTQELREALSATSHVPPPLLPLRFAGTQELREVPEAMAYIERMEEKPDLLLTMNK